MHVNIYCSTDATVGALSCLWTGQVTRIVIKYSCVTLQLVTTDTRLIIFYHPARAPAMGEMIEMSLYRIDVQGASRKDGTNEQEAIL